MNDEDDMVNHPPHYTQGGIECIDAISAALGPEGFVAFLRGQVIKYAWRLGRKGPPDEDAGKLCWYAERLAEATSSMPDEAEGAAIAEGRHRVADVLMETAPGAAPFTSAEFVRAEIDWERGPKWASWYAIDKNGDGFFYEDRPVWHPGGAVWLMPPGGSVAVRYAKTDTSVTPALYARVG